MNSALWASKTGLDAQQTRMSVISNNLANANTTGFKRTRAMFEDLLYQNRAQAGGQNTQETRLPTGKMLGTGVRLVATQKTFGQGNILTTDNPLDLSISGRGFFQVLLSDGSLAFTRDGSFQRNDEGEMVTSTGNVLQPGINLPEDTQSVTIGSDGTVSVQLPGQAAPTQVGTIELVDFINQAGLQPKGENLFLETAASGAPRAGTPGLNGLGGLQQGALEGSNVNVVEELVTMIETQRAYELNSKAIATSDQMLQYVNNNL